MVVVVVVVTRPRPRPRLGGAGGASVPASSSLSSHGGGSMARGTSLSLSLSLSHSGGGTTRGMLTSSWLALPWQRGPYGVDVGVDASSLTRDTWCWSSSPRIVTAGVARRGRGRVHWGGRGYGGVTDVAPMLLARGSGGMGGGMASSLSCRIRWRRVPDGWHNERCMPRLKTS